MEAASGFSSHSSSSPFFSSLYVRDPFSFFLFTSFSALRLFYYLKVARLPFAICHQG